MSSSAACQQRFGEWQDDRWQSVAWQWEGGAHLNLPLFFFFDAVDLIYSTFLEGSILHPWNGDLTPNSLKLVHRKLRWLITVALKLVDGRQITFNKLGIDSCCQGSSQQCSGKTCDGAPKKCSKPPMSTNRHNKQKGIENCHLTWNTELYPSRPPDGELPKW